MVTLSFACSLLIHEFSLAQAFVRSFVYYLPCTNIQGRERGHVLAFGFLIGFSLAQAFVLPFVHSCAVHQPPSEGNVVAYLLWRFLIVLTVNLFRLLLCALAFEPPSAFSLLSR